MARPENPVEYTSTGEFYRGSLIRELRRKKGLSRKRMANLLGCDPDSLSKIETNGVNPSQQMLLKIAEVLETPLEYFTKAPVHPRILRKKAAQAVAQPTPSWTQPAVRQLTQKASSASAVYHSTLSPRHQKILRHRLAALEKKLEVAKKDLEDAQEELHEIGVLAGRMFNKD